MFGLNVSCDIVGGFIGILKSSILSFSFCFETRKPLVSEGNRNMFHGIFDLQVLMITVGTISARR